MSSSFKSRCGEKYLRCLLNNGYPATNGDLILFNKIFYESNDLFGGDRDYAKKITHNLYQEIKDNEVPHWVVKSAELTAMFNLVVDDYKTKYSDSDQQQQPAVIKQTGGQQGAQKRKQPTAPAVPPAKKPAPPSAQTKDDEEKKKMQLEMKQKDKKIGQLEKEMEKQHKEIQDWKTKHSKMEKAVEMEDDINAKNLELFEEQKTALADQKQKIHDLEEALRFGTSSSATRGDRSRSSSRPFIC